MAEAFLHIVLENMSSLIQGEIGLIMGVDEEMKKLSSTLTTIQAVLEDAEEQQLESKPIRNWLCKLSDLAYEIDDILDECAIHVSKLKHRNGQLSRYSLKKILFRHNIGRRMKHVTEKVDSVAAEHAKFHLREMPVERPREVAPTRETGSMLNESYHVYGRDEDKEKIVDILVNQVKENQEISLLPIIGIGGLGKTTLAQLVYNDQRVVEHFEKKLWVCVSDNFDIKTLVKAMIESATGSGSASDLIHLDALQRRLWELLNQKRYLLVLDDVWNDHQEKWFELKNILACGSTGASIILTTRLKKVADIMGTLPAHPLMGLSEEHCWMLFKQRAFGEEKQVYPNLEAIGKQIVKKCSGVPMAAKALGGLLRFKRKEEEWIYVKESEIWNLSQEETLILPALRLSYHHLTLPLRQCFAYCAVFPKDTIIRKEELIFLWMAQGYISSKGNLEMEDVGNEICNELILRSLLQVSGTNSLIMHDLVHDLARSIMENKVPGTRAEENITSASNNKIRQVNLQKKYVAFPRRAQKDMDMSSTLMKFSRMRVLDAALTTTKDLPSAVGNLKHLRYLNLRSSEISTLPDSLCSLWNLQTLILNYCRSLVALPKNMRCLNNLRHLCLEECTSLSEMPSKMRELTCLKTLSLFIVGISKGNQLEELQCLNLGGRLKIRHMERMENYMDAKKANLAEKKNLRHLSLVWGSNNGCNLGEDKDEKVLEALKPHPNIETLCVNGFSGRSFPVWMANTLQKVVKIDIVNCQNCMHLPQLGKLPLLKLLKFKNLKAEYIIENEVEGGNPANTVMFPSLEELSLRDLPNLKGLLKKPASREAFPTSSLEKLVRIEMVDCPNLLHLALPGKLPHLKFLKLANMQTMEYIIEDEADEGGNPVNTLMFPSLETLKLCNLPNLKGLLKEQVSREAFPNLLNLRIFGCLQLTLPRLSSLKRLAAWNCSSLTLASFSKLGGTLTSLELETEENMECIPIGTLENLSNPESLEISHAHQRSLPEQGLRALTSLTQLRIYYSRTLTCLLKGGCDTSPLWRV